MNFVRFIIHKKTIVITNQLLAFAKDLENPLTIEYLFNEYGRREISYTDEIYDENSIKVATFGDSFTLGAMNPIHKNIIFMD